MIPVSCAPEPASFHKNVRQKGQRAIAELRGHAPASRRRGRPRKALSKETTTIPADKLPPFWTSAIEDMLEAYKRRCSFLALYLEHATGNASIDHMIPKSREEHHVYEWVNYRLCAASINAMKRDLSGIIDPFECKDRWFALEFVGFQVIPGEHAPPELYREFEETLRILNDQRCLKAREEYYEQYQAGHIDFEYLQRRAPFVAQEIVRQNRKRQTKPKQLP